MSGTAVAPPTQRALRVGAAARQRARRRRQLRTLALVILVFAVVGVLVFPFYWMVVSTIQSTSLFTYPPQLVPAGASLDAYVAAFRQRPLGLWFWNTLLVSSATTALALVISITGAYSLSRYRTRLNTLAGIAVLATQMLPPTLLVVPTYVIFRELRLLDTLPGLVVADTAFSLPLCIWMLKGFFDATPRELEEAAQVDGASRLGALLRVVLPVALPGIIVVGVFSFMVAWNEFFFARTLISSEENWVLAVGLSSFVGEYVLQWSEMLAAAVIFCLPPVLLFGFVQRYLVTGLTGGAVKG